MNRTRPLLGLAALVAAAGLTVGLTTAQGAPPDATTSLAAAASQPSGLANGDPVLPEQAAPQAVANGLNADAAGVNEGTKKQAQGVALKKERVDPKDVLPEDTLINGCVPGYGKGAACLPSVPPSQAMHAGHLDTALLMQEWTCPEVRFVLPDGIAVDGKGKDGRGNATNAKGVDPLGLDSNKDGVACGAGDA